MQLLALRDTSRDHRTNQNYVADLIAKAQQGSRQRSDLSKSLKLKTLELHLSQVKADRLGKLADWEDTDVGR